MKTEMKQHLLLYILFIVNIIRNNITARDAKKRLFSRSALWGAKKDFAVQHAVINKAARVCVKKMKMLVQ